MGSAATGESRIEKHSQFSTSRERSDEVVALNENVQSEALI